MAGNMAEVVLRVKADASQVPAVTRALQDVEQDAERAGAALKDMGDGAGHVGQNFAKLAGAADLAAPGLGQVALGLADVADVGEVAAAVATALGVSMGTLAAVAAPLAIVVAGIALAWSSYSASAEEAREAQERLNAALDGVDPIAKRAASEIDKLRLNLGQVTQAQYDDNQIRKEFADLLESGTAGLQAEKAAIEAKMTAIGKATGEYLDYQDKLHEVNALIETSTTLNAQGEEAALANAEVARERAESEKVLAERLRAKAEAERNATAATKDATAAAKAQLDAEAAFLTGVDAEIAKLGQWGNTAADEVDRVFDGFAKYTAQWEEAGAAREAAMLSDMEMTAAWAEAQAEAAAKAQGNVTGGINAGASGVSGGMSALSSAGPIGAIIAAVVGAIQAIGNGLLDQVHAEVMTFIGTVGDLPEVISAAMERSMSDTIPALMEAIPKFIESAIRSLPQTLAATLGITATRAIVAAIGEWWSSVGGLQGLGQSVVEALGRWWRDAWAAVRDFLKHPLDRDQDGRRLGGEAIDASKRAMSFLWSGEFATGTDYVPRTGLALVHQGERIETARGGGGGMGARTSAGGGDVHLHLSGFAVGTADQLIRELNKHLGGSNRRLSWSA